MYKEINPAIFAIITFPFLFGVMFGDIMHGTMLFVFSVILCFSERKPGTIMGTMG
jgi:V-type H+-transporting ATPase subunit a